MFQGYGGLALTGDHLDISYRRPDAWLNFTPTGSLKSVAFDFGDPVAGPNVALGVITPVEGEVLDWKHSIDPVHHHGSDQFRVISGGEWVLAGRPMSVGDYAFQEAGWVYQEHPGAGGAAWQFLMMGDRRGARATLKLKRDMDLIADFGELGEVYGAPVVGKEYPHPAGDKGIAAVVTTAGACERGYLRGDIADVQGGALTGLLGDEKAGPVVHALRAGPNEVVAPACAYSTERLLIVVRGSCRIGETEYRAGDLRVQRSDAVMPDVISRADGLEAVLIVADRRGRPSLPANKAPAWMYAVDGLLRDLVPAPGGAQGHRQRVVA